MCTTRSNLSKEDFQHNVEYPQGSVITNVQPFLVGAVHGEEGAGKKGKTRGVCMGVCVVVGQTMTLCGG